MNSAALDSNQHDVSIRFVTFGDFVGDSRQRPFKGLRVKNDSAFGHKKRASPWG
jgi:hypothetical protein